MRIPGTEMLLVTGLLALIEVFLLGMQLVSWLYFPQERRGLLYTWLLVLMILYNVFGGFFPDPNIRWLNLKLQMILAYGSGFAVAAYIPYYFYKGFELEKLRVFAYKGMIMFLALPFLGFFVVNYYVSGDIDFAIRWGLIGPAFYGIAFLVSAYRAIRQRYRENLAAERVEMYLSYAAVWPWILMIPFAYLGVGQLPEVLTSNTGFLVISAILAARSVRERRQQQAEKDQQIRKLTQQAEEVFASACRAFDLTPREIEVVQLIRLGLTNKEIGVKLEIAEKTVSNHLQNLYQKTGARTRTELIHKLFY